MATITITITMITFACAFVYGAYELTKDTISTK